MTKPGVVRVGWVLLVGVALAGCGAPVDPEAPVAQKKSALTTTLFSPWVGSATGSFPQAVAIGDLNGDGRNDVALTTDGVSDPANDNMLHVFLQAADGTLLPRVKYALEDAPTLSTSAT